MITIHEIKVNIILSLVSKTVKQKIRTDTVHDNPSFA